MWQNAPRWGFLLVLLLLVLCTYNADCRRGGGGSRGGSRGSSSRGSSSGRGSSSSSNRGTTLDRSRDRGRTPDTRNPPAPPPKVEAPKVAKQPAHNPNYKEPAVNQQPPPYSPRERPPPYSPSAPAAGGQGTIRGQPPAYPGADYPRQPGGTNQQGGILPAQGGSSYPGANYPRQPGSNVPAQGGSSYPGANYPRQPGSNVPAQGGSSYPGANYPRQPGSNVPPGSYLPAQGGSSYPGANYPRQPGSNVPPGSNLPAQGGSSYPGANYPRQPGSNVPPGSNLPAQGGSSYPGANYPRQPGSNVPPSSNLPAQGGSGYPGPNYPRQPGSNYPQSGGSYPQGGTYHANYPRQPPPAYTPNQPLGGNVWRPQSGMAAPAYMNYGGIPTGANMASKPYKNKGFLGSVMGSGAMYGKNKYYGSYPSPYGMGGMGGMGRMNSFLGNRGSKAALFTILPLMALPLIASSFYRPRFGYMPMSYSSPFYHHHHYYGQGNAYGRDVYDVYNNNYAGRCTRPLAPSNGKVSCNSTFKEVDCDVTCDEGYLYPDNTTSKSNKCWHVTGVWRPEKNFPDCKPVCNRTCLNGGSCIGPDVCGCPPEYRGPNCEFYFLKCDIRKLAAGNRIRWVCSHYKNESICHVKCREGDFETPQYTYRCTTEGVWTPNYIPQCLITGKNSTEELTEENSAATPTTQLN